MKNFLIFSIALIVVIVAASCLGKNRAPVEKPTKWNTKPDETALYVDLYDRYQLQNFILYRNDTLLFNGRHHFDSIDYGGRHYKDVEPNVFTWMFITNIKKQDSIKFRLICLDKDTVFYVNAMNADRLKIVLLDNGRINVWDNHTEWAWTVE